MPQIFTSYDFGVQARSMGVPPSYTLWAISKYLLKRCGRTSHMTWNKKMPALGCSIVSGGDSEYDEKYRSKLNDALASMPNKFSSKEFILRCVSVGIPRAVFDGSDLCATFLKLNTDRLTYRSWSNKKCDRTEPLQEAKSFSTSVESSLSINECIEFLKSKGYKIMKPVSEWVEI